MQGWRILVIVVIVLAVFALVGYVGVMFMGVSGGRTY
jgi:hypothetical protein